MPRLRVEIFDNQGETADRFSAVFRDGWQHLGSMLLSDRCNMPNGVCMWADGRCDNGVSVRSRELPPQVRQRILTELQWLRAAYLT